MCYIKGRNIYTISGKFPGVVHNEGQWHHQRWKQATFIIQKNENNTVTD